MKQLSQRAILLNVALAGLAGAVLRLLFLDGQILLDDEWHAMDYAAAHSLGYLLTHFSVPGATCPPMNIYSYLLLHTIGWNETLLRLPAILPGLASLAILPLLVARVFGGRTAILFSWLLAICPFLVFYGRIARPYSMVALAGSALVLCSYEWLRTGGRRWAAGAVVCGVLAVYFHLFAAVSIVATLGCAAAVRAFPALRARGWERVVPTFGGLALAALFMVAALGALLGPAFVNTAGRPASHVVGADRMTAQTLAGVASMMAGTGRGGLVVAFWGWLLVGAVCLARRSPLLASILAANAAAYLAGLIVMRPISVQAPLVVARYAVALFPLGLALAALGIVEAMGVAVRFLTIRKANAVLRLLPDLAAAAFVGALLACGPLPAAYRFPNNFMSHSSFLESYAPMRWDRSYECDMFAKEAFIQGFNSLPPFYHRLAAATDCRAIIEYPMFIGNHFNLFYYYQRHHRKSVVAGYALVGDPQPAALGFVGGNWYIDQVVNKAPDASRLRFTNMANVADVEALRRSRAGYVILHKSLIAEMFPTMPIRMIAPYAPIEELAQAYRLCFGPPAYEDAHLIVFDLRKAAH